MDKPTVDQAIHFIEKLEACTSMPAKLVLLRGFCEKYAGAPPQAEALSHVNDNPVQQALRK